MAEVKIVIPNGPKTLMLGASKIGAVVENHGESCWLTLTGETFTPAALRSIADALDNNIGKKVIHD